MSILLELKNYIGKLNAQNWKNYEDFNELSCPGTQFPLKLSMLPFFKYKIIVISLPLQLQN